MEASASRSNPDVCYVTPDLTEASRCFRCYCDSSFRNSLGATISADKCDSPCKGGWLSLINSTALRQIKLTQRASISNFVAVIRRYLDQVRRQLHPQRLHQSLHGRRSPLGMDLSRMSPGRTGSHLHRLLDRPRLDRHDRLVRQALREQGLWIGRDPVRITVRPLSAVCYRAPVSRADHSYTLDLLAFLPRCSCDSAYRNNLGGVVATDQCNSDCKGDTSTKCGGSYLNSVFSNAGLLSGLPAGWSAVGCTIDGPARALTGYNVDLGTSGATIPACIKVCADKGYSYSAMQYGSQCYCDSDLRNGLGTVVSDDQCSSPCKGDQSTSCGGSYRSNLFKSSNAPVSASSTVSASATSSASAAAATVSGAPGWTSIGCTQDGPSKALTSKFVDLGASATVEGCLKVCQDGGWALASLQYGSQCMCGASFSNNLGQSIPASSCPMACKGNSAQSCGGSYTSNSYKFTGSLVSSASSASSAPTASASSLTGGTWSYYGCASSSSATSWSSGGTGGYSQDTCEQTCLQKGSPIAALEYGGQCRCFAKQSDIGGRVKDEQCNMQCTANTQQFCGAG
jgi:hypothetical protein